MRMEKENVAIENSKSGVHFIKQKGTNAELKPDNKNVKKEKDISTENNSASKPIKRRRSSRIDSCIGYRSHAVDSEDEASIIEGSCEDHQNSIALNSNKIKRTHKKYSWSLLKSEDNFSKKLASNFPQFHLTRIDNILESSSAQNTLEMLAVVSAYCIYHCFGSPTQKDVDQNKLISYLHHFVPLGSNVIKKCLDKAKAFPHPNFALHVKIKEACGLRHKISSKYGHPFCKVWIMSHSRNYEYTEMINNEDHPVWNKEFYFALKDPNNDTLMVEVWDNDKDGIIESETKVKGRYCWPCIACKNFCFGGETKLSAFIGLFQFELKNLPMEGTDEWVIIKSRTRKIEKGRLHIEIKVGVAGIKSNVDLFKRHMLLIKECVQEGLESSMEDQRPIDRLEDIISPPGMTLIFLHSAISGLSECEDAVCKFIVLNRIRSQNDLISLRVIFRMLNETGDCMDQKCFEGSLENTLEETYRKEAESLHDKCFTMLNALHTFDLVNDQRMLDDFEFSLRCIHTCQEMLLISSAPLRSLKSEAQDWVELKGEELKETFPEDEAKYTIELLDYLTFFHKAADKVIKKIYPDETYTKLTFDSLNKLSDPLETLVTTFIARIEESEEDIQTNIKKGIEILSKMKYFVTYIVHVAQKKEDDLQICQFQNWFGENFFTKCFQERQELAKSRTINAVNDDVRAKLETSKDGRKLQNESVNIVLEIIRKYLRSLWKVISYPRSSKWDLLFVDAVYQTCLEYYSAKRKVIEQQCSKSNLCEKDLIDLRILANNLWALSSGVAELIADTIKELPSEAEDSTKKLEEFCKLVSKDISEILMKDIRKYVEEIITCDTNEDQNAAVEAYEEYFKTTMSEASSSLIADAYKCLQMELWNNILVLMGQYVIMPMKSEVKLKNKDKEEDLKKELHYRGYFKILTSSRNILFSKQEQALVRIKDNKVYKELLENIERNLKK